MSDNYTIEVKKRPWWEWVLWAVWFVFEVIVFQNAVASGAELEPRAATIFWIVFFVFLIAGGVVWYLRRER